MDLNPIDLGNGILLFKNVLKNPEEVYKFVLDSKTNDDPYFGKHKWYDWKPWGNYAKAYPATDESYKTSPAYGAKLQKECLDIFFNVLKIYKEKYFDDAYFEKYKYDKDIPTSLEELETRQRSGDNRFQIADMPLFETNKNVTPEWQMHIHTDIVPWWGGARHMFNFNIYVNDDYEGGEILFFKIDGVEKAPYIDTYSGKPGEAYLVEDYFVYKMQAGDGLIFPTDYQHGVLPLKSGEKYYIRQFLTNRDHPDLQMYKDRFSASCEFDAFYEEEKKKIPLMRVTPVLFDSLDNIDLDSPKYSGMLEQHPACVIKTKKDISFLNN